MLAGYERLEDAFGDDETRFRRLRPRHAGSGRGQHAGRGIALLWREQQRVSSAVAARFRIIGSRKEDAVAPMREATAARGRDLGVRRVRRSDLAPVLEQARAGGKRVRETVPVRQAGRWRGDPAMTVAVTQPG